MKTVRGDLRFDQVTNSPCPPVRLSSDLTVEQQAEVERVESALETMFDDAFVARNKAVENDSLATDPALPSAKVDESWLRQEIERYQLANRQLHLENMMLREEIKKYPLVDDPVLVQLLGSLTVNDRFILTAMYELAATKAKPESSEVIVAFALSSGDHKTAFNRLKAEELVGTTLGRGGGQWLTARGRHVALVLMLQEP